MRVATISIYSSSKYELSRTLTDYNEASSAVTTGKRIQSPGDDPVGYAQVLDLESTLSQLDQVHDNIDTGLTWLSSTETALNSVLDTILEAKQLGIAATDGIYNEEDYETAAEQMQELLEQMVDFANTNVSGQYIFSGTKTDTQPYTLDGDTITYEGNGDAFTVSTGTGSRTDVSYSGDEVFGEVADADGDGNNDDLFSLLIRMRDDLSDNNGANLEGMMEELDAFYENVNTLTSDVGIKTNRLETKESVISDFELTLEEQKSGIEDVDLTEAATDLALRETAYQAALSATSTIIKMSLVDYI